MKHPVCLADLWDIPEPEPRVVMRGPGDGLAIVEPWVYGVIDAAVDEVRRQGVDVRFLDGWRDRGRRSRFIPGGAVDHHTGGPAFSGEDWWWTILYLVRDGRSDLPGPLSQVCTWPDGTLWIVAAGTSNHAGPGGWNGLAENSRVWGNEMVHSGGPNEPWPNAQLRTALLWDVALARHTGYGPESVCEHKEWSTAGKVDRIIIDGDDWRGQVASLLSQEDDMSFTQQDREHTTHASQMIERLYEGLIRPLGDGDEEKGFARLRAAVTAEESGGVDVDAVAEAVVDRVIERLGRAVEQLGQ